MTVKRRWICISTLLAALVIAVVILKPRYDAFVQADYQETCHKAMEIIAIRYHYAVRESLDAGMQPDEIDYEKLLRRIVGKFYTMTLKDDLSSDDFCRAGGHVQIMLDPTTHSISMSCNYPGHDECYSDDYITDEFLNDWKKMGSGIDVMEP